MPEGLSPATIIGELYGCYSLIVNGWSASGERKLSCAQKGISKGYYATAAGGRFNENGKCASAGAGPIYSTVTITNEKEIEIISPNGRIKKGIEDIVVQYDFKYNNCNTCPEGSCANRIVSVDSVGTQSNLPVSGTASFPYNFSNANGVVKITARACCGGSCIITDKLVYIEPEEDDCKLQAGKPVGLASGKVTVSEKDFSISGVMPIDFTRHYNSKSPQINEFASKWSHTFSTRAIGWGNAYQVINADGFIYYYMDNDGDKIYEPELPKGIKSRVIKNPNNSIIREFNDGAKEEFNASGYLTSVVDRNGNRIRLTRDTGNRLTKITDPSGREATLTYDIYNRINQITLPDGKIISKPLPIVKTKNWLL
ncbi:MAG: DUF6531 domain-containing protein [Nitrospirota bacterium]